LPKFIDFLNICLSLTSESLKIGLLGVALYDTDTDTVIFFVW